MIRKPSIIEFVTDPGLLGLSLSDAQETLLRGIYGLPLPSPHHLEIWRLCTGRDRYPDQSFEEVTVVAGARSGKDSRIAAPTICYEAVFGGHAERLSKGERGIMPLVAQDARAAHIAFDYICKYFTGSPILSSLVADVRASEITLTNGLSISCFPCTIRSLRGWSIPAAVMDEVAFFRLEGQADADVEVQTSIRRGMINFPSTRLIKISTPYMRSGVLYEDFARAFGKNDPDLLVWRAPSTLMNPVITDKRLERLRRLDPRRFAREYEAEFSDDAAAFLPMVWIDAAVVPQRYSLPPHNNVQYFMAVDPTGGGANSFTATIVHADGRDADLRVIQDFLKGWGPRRSEQVDLEGIVADIATTAKRYGVRTVYGDRYSRDWVAQAFQRHGLKYDSDHGLDKSGAYLEMEPLFAEGRISILDDKTLHRELVTLERRPKAGGKTVVDHPNGGHDDYANALALAAAIASKRPKRRILEGYGYTAYPPTSDFSTRDAKRYNDEVVDENLQANDDLLKDGWRRIDPSTL